MADKDNATLAMIHRVVSEVAPRESPIVDQLYEDFLADPALFGATISPRGREHALGDPATLTLVSSIVIPVVVSVVAHVIGKGFDEIVAVLRNKAQNQLSDDDIVRLAKAIAAQQPK